MQHHADPALPLVGGEVHHDAQAPREHGARVRDAGGVVRDERGELELGVMPHAVEEREAPRRGLAEGHERVRLAGPQARAVLEARERRVVRRCRALVVGKPEVLDREALGAPGGEGGLVEGGPFGGHEEFVRGAREGGGGELDGGMQAAVAVTAVGVLGEDYGVAVAGCALGERGVDEVGDVDFHFWTMASIH